MFNGERAQRASVISCDTDWHREADCVGWYKQACSEGGEVPCAANSSAGVSLCQGHHAISAPLLVTLTEVLTQGGKHPDLQADTHRPRAGAAGRTHVDEVVQCGVIEPVEHRENLTQTIIQNKQASSFKDRLSTMSFN